MASALSHRPLSRLLAPARNGSWPRARWQRFACRLLFALPLAGLALWAHHQGFADTELALLERQADLTKAGGPDLSGLRYAYPPLPILLALVLPGGTLALAIVTCLCSGATLLYITQRLHRRLSLVITAVLLAPLVAVPVMWYMASQLLAPIISLSFLAIALDGFVRFAAYGETEAGFAAGIALALSYCADPGALLYGAVMCLFAPLISHLRYHDDSSATTGIGAVLFFPIAAAALSWAFLVWRFSGTFPGSLHYAAGARVLAFPSGVLGGLAGAAGTALIDLLHAPLYLLAVALFARPAARLGTALPVIALIAALWLGFAYSEVTAYFMFTILALTAIAHSPAQRLQRWLVATAVLQLALAIAWPPTSLGFSAWVHAVTR
jgi:hypothetical protein